MSDSCVSDHATMLHTPAILQLNGEQQSVGLEVMHNVSTLLCLLSTQATSLEALRSEILSEIRTAFGAASSGCQSSSGQGGVAKSQHKASHNQRLEELRNLQVGNEFFFCLLPLFVIALFAL